MKLMAVVKGRLAEAEYRQATQDTYERWIRRYVRYFLPQHPRQVGQAGVDGYITYLAAEREMSASSQNQALDAIKFLYDCLEIPVETAHLRARVGRHQPETASYREIMPVIDLLADREKLLALLIYGSGLSLNQACELRLGQVDLAKAALHVGKHGRPLAARCVQPLRQQIERASDWPGNVAGYVFPSSRIVNGRCWYVSPTSLQKAMNAVCKKLGLARHITPRVLRHSFVSGLLDEYDPRTVKEVCGYTNVETLVRRQDQQRITNTVISPFDAVYAYIEKEGY